MTSWVTKRELRLAGVALALALALTSCVSPEELRRDDEAACAGYGFHPNTDAFATCLQRESLARRASTSYPPLPYLGGGYWGGPWGPYWP
ncbi:MAG: hypothetical protein WA633_14880 [Stellaceae bacterium]